MEMSQKKTYVISYGRITIHNTTIWTQERITDKCSGKMVSERTIISTDMPEWVLKVIGIKK